MKPLEAAIMRTILYGDVFDFPMTLQEIHHFLIHSTPITFAIVEQTFNHSTLLSKYLVLDQEYIACKGREHIIALRRERVEISKKMWKDVQHYGYRLARLPFVRMVAVTGALTMHNGVENDDLDYMLITEPGRVWLARAFAIVLVRYGKLRHVTVCPNYVLAESKLEQTRKDLYIAHEIVQMIPLYGNAVYTKLRGCNLWVDDYLANADAPFHPEKEWRHGVVWSLIKRGLERVLGGTLGTRLENWERQRKMKRFASEVEKPSAAAELDSAQVKGHFDDYGQRILKAYNERLDAYDLSNLSLAGD